MQNIVKKKKEKKKEKGKERKENMTRKKWKVNYLRIDGRERRIIKEGGECNNRQR